MITIGSNLPEFTAKIRVAAQLLKSRRKSIHKAFGIYLLSKAKQDFETMSRGGTSSFGVQWKPIKDQTLKGRITKLKNYKDKAAAVRKSKKALVTGRAKLREAHQLLLESTRNSRAYKSAASKVRKARTKINAHKRIIAAVKVSASGRKSQVTRLQAKAKVLRNKRSIERLEKKVAVARAQRQKLRAAPNSHAATMKKLEGRLAKARTTRTKYLAKMTASHQIGVDTGRLRNSAQPGYDGGDGKGGNIFEATEVGVKVGYGRTYAGHFDEERKLLPGEGEVPKEWVAGLEALAKRQTLAALGQAFKGETGTVTETGGPEL